MKYNQDVEIILKNLETIAVIGASNDPSKYGYKVYKDLKDKGFEVYAVNNKRDEIQGDKCYKEIANLPKKVDILNFIVSPQISLIITKKAIDIGYKSLWYQPGSSNRELIDYLKNKDVCVIDGLCVMIETNT